MPASTIAQPEESAAPLPQAGGRRRSWPPTLTQKAALGLGLLVAALLVMGAGLYGALSDADQRISHVVQSAVPEATTAMALANVVSEASLKIENYARRPETALRAGVMQDFERFDGLLRQHEQQASSENARLLGRAAASLLTEYRNRGLGLMALADEWQQHLVQTMTDLSRFDELIDAQSMSHAVGHSGSSVAQRVAAQALRAQAAAVGRSLAEYGNGGGRAQRQAVEARFADFEEALNTTAVLVSGRDELRLVERIRSEWSGLRQAIKLAISIRDESERDLAHFHWLRGLFKRIDVDLRLEADVQRAAAITAVQSSRQRASLALLWGLGLAVLSAIGAYAWIERSIRRPLRALNDGAHAIAHGQLDVRLQTSGHPDFDQVLQGFNRMAERLEQTTVSKARLEESEQRFDHAVRGSQAGIWDWDMASDRYYVSPRLAQMLGYGEHELPTDRQRIKQLIHPDDVERFDATVAAHFKRHEPYRIEFRLRRKDGRYLWCRDIGQALWHPDGRVRRFSGSISDIDAQKQAEAQIERMAYFDGLTDLPGRSLFADRLRQAMIDARRHQRHVGVVFLDLDRFKAVNDEYGHAAGDALLCAVARRLQACVRDGDTVGRFSGDEFGVVLADVRQAADVAQLAQKFVDAFAAPFQIGGHECFVTPSIGISMYPADGDSEPELLRAADVAMYRTKQQGGNNHGFFTADMNARARDRLALEAGLRRALERDELSLAYQPVVRPNGEVIGVEALLRWQHPSLGPVSPAQFIPLAEETGLIVPIGDWVLREACAQWRRWRAQGHPPLMLAVNLSIRQLRQRGWAETAAAIIAQAGVDPACVEFEITESVLAEDAACADALREIAATGVRLSIDDFGTGYSSLSYLKRLPIDTLKIDQSFMRGIPGTAVDAAIVTAILAMARSLGLHVIAEGVEHAAQLDFLRAQDCPAMQGYHFGRPMPADEISRRLGAERAVALAE